MTSVPPPICGICKHFRGPWTCDAFPKRIPNEIIESKHDHREPYPGDHGIRFEPLPGERHPMEDA
jgi:hypothetical protein